MQSHLNISKSEVEAFCKRWQLIEFSIFGSAARGTLSPASDVDVLIAFDRDAKPTLAHLSRMRRELEAMVGRQVDLVTRTAIEQSANQARRQSILRDTETIYAA